MKSLFHVHLVSDSTGETVISVARACTAQFDQAQPVEHFWNLVRTQRQIDDIVENIKLNPGVILYTIVDQSLRQMFEEKCRTLQVPLIAVLDPVLFGLSSYLKLKSQSQPGRQHSLNEEYFHRIEAMEFALSNDDGQATWKLSVADVILVGVSRTSKTPTCIYLANRGIKAANVPFVPGIALPEELLAEKTALIVGLTEDAERLVHIRKNRLREMNQAENTSYVDLEMVRQELNEARRFYAKMGWPVIDVTRRSVEETAAEIIKILNRRALNHEANV